MKAKKWILNILTTLIVIVSLCFLGLRFTTARVYIDGQSMMPTLQDLSEGRMLTTQSRKNKIKRFDIIIFESEVLHETLIKRVIGLPGETISINSTTGELTINQQTVLQNFIPNDDTMKSWEETKRLTCSGSRGLACGKEFTIPENEYYVLGDNRNHSTDSEHGLGTVSKKEIIGVLWYIDTICEEIDETQRVCVKKKKVKIQTF